MTVFLCTTGTSAAKNLRDDSGKPLLNGRWVAEQGGVEAAAERILQSFAGFGKDDDTALQRRLSAEIHSLARMGVAADDRVILFSSETAEGEACARAVRLYLQEQRPGLECKVEVVPGLQVDNARDFRTRGVMEFTRRVLRWIAGYGAEQCVLNPTGGFKSLVPYAVLIGMLKGVAARYIFEQSSALIDLPRLPVEFAAGRLAPWQDLIDRVERDSYLPEREFEAAVPYEERAALDPLFEREGDAVTLSPVGLLILEEIRMPRGLVPFVSRRAIDDLGHLANTEGCKPLDFLNRVARSREQLERASHDRLSNGLCWLKPGDHTRDRYLVSVEGWRLLVWRMVDHDEYDDLQQQDRCGDLGARFVADRRSRYEPFFRLDTYGQPST
jgi:putative CRISPR-associated protein (TIGR02619 family)